MSKMKLKRRKKLKFTKNLKKKSIKKILNMKL